MTETPASPTPEFPDRVLAVLAATATAQRTGTRPGAEASLQLFLLDGLLEALEWANDGIAADEAACMWLAGLRWHCAVTGTFPEGAPEPMPRWIDEAFGPALAAGTEPGDPANLAGLSAPAMGTTSHPPAGDADGTGVLARAAGMALLPLVTTETTTKLAVDAAALTHGSPAAWAGAAAAARLVRAALDGREAALVALEDVTATEDLAGEPSEGTAWAAVRGSAAAASAALADPSLKPAEAFAAAGAAAPAGAAGLAGAVVAAALGSEAVPAGWEAAPEGPVIAELAARWTKAILG
ncbi:hypothetical protein GCM10023081_06640 [Arthrobacter ginkgonis]|uniref:ADP-ribosylglycohydrolase n=1 Tax=Arthrobacter ginkgonis TaxID=1630594 RepID=A0ABP7BVM7_9MICC